MQKKKNIEIIPIFDQSVENIWADFTHIETLCNLDYGYKVDAGTKADIYNRNVNEWKKQKYTFAFGAYDDKKMVGFASGYREDGAEMYLHNLYVMPEYKGIGIGKSLLEQSERSATLGADNMTVISLTEALGFYEKYGYSTRDKRNCEKKLQGNIIGVVPVFKPIGWLRDVKINLDIDITKLEKYKKQPIFAYVSLGREIDGLVIKTATGGTKLWTNPNKGGMKDFYEKKLLSALAKLR